MHTFTHTRRHMIKRRCDKTVVEHFYLLQPVFRPSGLFSEAFTGVLPDPTEQQQTVNIGDDGPVGQYSPL